MKIHQKLALLLALSALCLTASAQSVPEQVQAPEHVQGTYQSPTGRTTVSLDAQVVVPQVAAMPMVEVFPRLFEPAEARALADLMMGENQWEAWVQGPSGPERDSSLEPDYQATSYDTGSNHVISLDSKELDAKGHALRQVVCGYFILSTLPDLPHGNALEYRFKICNNQGRSLPSLEEARALADPVVAQLFPGMHFHSADPETFNLSDRCVQDNNQGDYGHRLYYVRQIHAAPVTLVSQQGAGEAFINLYSRTLPYEKLFVDVGEDGIFQIKYKNPLRLGEVLQEAPALLPFDQILDIFAQVAPLKYAAHEKEKNNGIQVSQVVLGYMHLQIKDQPERYQMVPVWDFMGSRTIGRERFDEANTALLTINATDGTVIDRDLGY